jgi:restriction system protein
MARTRESPAEALMEAVAMLPWWVGVVLAMLFYVVLSRFAESPVPVGGGVGQIGAQVAGQIWRTLAMFGQYLLPLIFLAGALVSAVGRAKRKRLYVGVTNDNTAGVLHGLSWREFELLVGEAFRRHGYSVVEPGGGGADGGVDLELARDGARYLVQCKQWKASRVSVQTVRELYGVVAKVGAAGGIVVTSGRFTPDAVAFAKGAEIELIDGLGLRRLIDGVDVPVAAKAAASGPHCPACGGAMVRRKATRGANAGSEFWGCSGYPACQGTRSA